MNLVPWHWVTPSLATLLEIRTVDLHASLLSKERISHKRLGSCCESRISKSVVRKKKFNRIMNSFGDILDDQSFHPGKIPFCRRNWGVLWSGCNPALHTHGGGKDFRRAWYIQFSPLLGVYLMYKESLTPFSYIYRLVMGSRSEANAKVKGLWMNYLYEWVDRQSTGYTRE